MARRGLNGQLNMFDFFQNGEDGEVGEVEMVSLMPSFEDEVPKKKPRKVKKELSQDAVMSRTYEVNGETIEVSYLNYNKVRVRKGTEEPKMHYFENSKDAVDFYVQYMQEIEHEG